MVQNIEEMPSEIAPFSRKSAACRAGSYVDIVAVVGSIPATPTTQPLEIINTAGLFTKFPLGSTNLEAGRNGAGNTASALTT